MSPRHKNILVLVDGSRGSLNALTESIRLARWTRANVTAVAAVPPYEGDLSLVGVKRVMDAMEGEFTASLKEALDVADAMRSDIGVAYVTGDPGISLVEMVEARSVDLLVLGISKPYSILDVLAGGIVTSLLERCGQDMLFVPEGRALGWENTLFVACASDLTDGTVDGVLDLSASYGGRLRTMAVRGGGRWPLRGGEPGGALASRQVVPQEVVREVRVRATVAGSTVEGFVEDGGPLRGLERMAREDPVQLVVTGRRDKVGIRGLWCGLSLERLIHRSPCPVLAFGPERSLDGAGGFARSHSA